MADVRPFRAVRYARPSPDVTAPPYDVLDDDASAALRARDPHNVVWLTSDPDPAAGGERYRRWLEEGVLVREETPAVWLLDQDVRLADGTMGRRRGVVASLRVEPYSTGVVLPHERTHAKVKAERLRLLRAAGAQLEPILLLHEGPPVLAPPVGDPDLGADGARLWRLDGDAGVAEAFAGRQLLIADGHHRYETAVAYAEEGGPDRMLVVLVSTEDPGLVILPTHRVFSGREDVDAEGAAFPTVGDALEALEAEPYDRAAAVLVRPGGVRLVRGAAGELDVELVDRFGSDGLGYTPDRDEAVRRVEAGEATAAFLLRPTRIEDVFERARRGVAMPPKTTYFAPKLVSGLLFHPLEP